MIKFGRRLERWAASAIVLEMTHDERLRVVKRLIVVGKEVRAALPMWVCMCVCMWVWAIIVRVLESLFF